jgi:uncharacterized protein with FMN-binding domain
MKKFLLSATVLTIFVIYALHTNLENESAATITIKPNQPFIPSSSPANVPVATLGPTPNSTVSTSLTALPTAQPTPAATPQGRYKNGTYTGSVADAFYGNVQVRVIVSGGNITDVQFLQYPSDRSTSRFINSQAMPLLTQEAIQAQSAQVDGVSGATATSGAFIQSLQSALQQAS